jgi:hypothetical protein
MEDVFIGSEALAGGVLTRGQLRWNYRALFPDVYVHGGAVPSVAQRAVGAWLWSGRRAVVAGLAAAALHGARWVDDSIDVEVIWRHGRPPRGIVTRGERIESDEIMDVAGVPVTTPERTAFDLARHNRRDYVVARLDALSSVTGIAASAVQPLCERYRGSRHWWRAIDALSLMDGGSQSPAETLVRLALIDSGLPRPKTQIAVADGEASAVIAMGYELPMVGVEFVSDTTEFVMTRGGWKVFRATEPFRPHTIVYLVRAAVIERGYPLLKLRRLSLCA